MQIKLVNTITKWCIWPLGVESRLRFLDKLEENIWVLILVYTVESAEAESLVLVV